jgi:hypothetical protein
MSDHGVAKALMTSSVVAEARLQAKRHVRMPLSVASTMYAVCFESSSGALHDFTTKSVVISHNELLRLDADPAHRTALFGEMV